jgi:protein SSD1
VYWKKGVDVVKWLAERSGDTHLQHMKQTAERHAKLMEATSQQAQAESALFDDDDEEDVNVIVDASNGSDATTTSAQRIKSMSRARPQFEATQVTASGHHIQTVKELQTVPVIITADLSKSPPVIKVRYPISDLNPAAFPLFADAGPFLSHQVLAVNPFA